MICKGVLIISDHRSYARRKKKKTRADTMAGKGTAAEYLRNSPNYKITAGPVSAKSKGTSDRHSPRKKITFLL